MQTNMSVKKLELIPGRTNNRMNKTTANKKNVRTTDHKKLLQIMINNPYAITREEFIVLQSAIGYRRAVEIREKAIQLKKHRESGQTNVAMNPSSLEKSKSGIGKKNASELKNNAENSPLQMKKDDGNTAISSSGMKQNLREGLEKLSGVDLSDVKVHQNSDKPQQIGALAYTQGNDIYIAPGQERHLPHEGWHAVQQKQGRVGHTLQMKTGMPINEDSVLEKEADIMGGKAVIKGSKESIVQCKKTSSTNYEKKVIKYALIKAYEVMTSYLNGKKVKSKALNRAMKYAATYGPQKKLMSLNGYDSFDTQILAWTNYWNDKYGTNLDANIVKAMICQESHMGNSRNKNGTISKNSDRDIMQSLFVGDPSFWEQSRTDFTGLSSYNKTTKRITVIKPDGTKDTADTPARAGGNYDPNEAADFIPAKGFGVLHKVIKDGKVIYDKVTPTMSIAMGINWLKYKIYEKDGKVKEGVAAYGPAGYVNDVNTWLKKMGHPTL